MADVQVTSDGDQGGKVTVENSTIPTHRTQGEAVEKLRWKFVINDPGTNYDGMSTIGETGAKPIAAPDCVLWVWAQEVFGQESPSTFRLDTDDLVGRKVQVRIAHRRYQKDGVEKNFVHVADVARMSVPFVAQQAQPTTVTPAIQPSIIASDDEPVTPRGSALGS